MFDNIGVSYDSSVPIRGEMTFAGSFQSQLTYIDIMKELFWYLRSMIFSGNPTVLGGERPTMTASGFRHSDIPYPP